MLVLANVSHISSCIRIQISKSVIFTSNSSAFQLIFNTTIHNALFKNVAFGPSAHLFSIESPDNFQVTLRVTRVHPSAAAERLLFLDGHACPQFPFLLLGLCLFYLKPSQTDFDPHHPITEWPDPFSSWRLCWTDMLIFSFVWDS